MAFGKIDKTNLDFEEIPYILNVAGVSWGNRQKVVAKLEPGMILILERDPNNEYDRNAIAVKTKDNEEVGWIPKKYAEVLAPEMDAGINWCAKVDRVIGQDKDLLGVLIKLFLSN